jgi:uncharacterized membrane protein
MEVFAHGDAAHLWRGWVEPWEIHPALNHFAIAFLIAAVVVDLYDWCRPGAGARHAATGLLIAGFLTGIVTALAGVLAFFTVPGHTAEAHRLMWYHMGVQGAALLLFAWPTWWRWRHASQIPIVPVRLLSCLAALTLLVGSGIGGYLVYHGGAGIEENLLAPWVRESHEHHGHDRQDHKDHREHDGEIHEHHGEHHHGDESPSSQNETPG